MAGENRYWSVGADRGHRRLDVVDADAVVREHLVVLVELRLEPSEVGVPGRARVVVLPLLGVLGPDLVLGRPRDEDLAERADPLGAPAAAPDLLDLVVEVALVEHEVPERLPGLEPRERLEHLTFVVQRGGPRRRVRELGRRAVGGPDAERDGLARRRVGDGHGAPPLLAVRRPRQSYFRVSARRRPVPALLGR